MLEKMSSCPGFLVLAGIAGGTGSGISSRLLVELRDAFELSNMSTFTIFPLTKGETPMQHYNCGFSLSYMQDYADHVVGGM